MLYPCYENMTINDPDGIAAFEEDAEGGPTSLIVQVIEKAITLTVIVWL